MNDDTGATIEQIANDLSEPAVQGLLALCDAEAEYSDASVQTRLTRARERLDSESPGASEHLDTTAFRELGLIDERTFVTPVGQAVARRHGWQGS